MVRHKGRRKQGQRSIARSVMVMMRRKIKVRVRPHVAGVGSHPMIGAPLGTILVSARMPKKWRKPLVFHERVEYGLMRKSFLCKYNEAHRLANKAERAKYFKGKKKDWKKYMATVRRIHRSGAGKRRRRRI